MHKILYVHVGKHKTGTTSIQAYLKQNSITFKEKGVFPISHFDVFGKSNISANPYNSVQLSHLCLRNDLLTPVRLRLNNYFLKPELEMNAILLDANERLHQLPGSKFILSSEAFSFMRTEDEKIRFKKLFNGFDVRPIVVFREKKSWLKSWESQVKRNLSDKYPEEKKNEQGIFNFQPNSWLVDDERIRDFFGPKAHLIDYDKELKKHQNIIPSILEKLFSSDVNGFFDVKKVWHNRTPKNLLIE